MRTSLGGIALIGALLLAAPAGAQQAGAQQTGATQAAAQSAAPEAASPTPASPSTALRLQYGRSVIPVIVTTDGRTYANVGHGWEPVVAPCAPGVCVKTAPIAPAGQSAYKLPEYRPPTYTVPTYGPPKYP